MYVRKNGRYLGITFEAKDELYFSCSPSDFVYPTFYPTFYPTPSVAKPFLSDQLQFKKRGFYILTFPPQQQGLLKGERKTMKINPYAARSAFKGLAWLGWRGRGKNLLGKKTRTKGGKERKLRCVKY